MINIEDPTGTIDASPILGFRETSPQDGGDMAVRTVGRVRIVADPSPQASSRHLSS